ncbi:MAG: formate dehydrogenase accessory sulfurtransferase FdhD [Opitutae bacterium]|nr:formate dehydrogenase accessory sulfurtransferase FdhD [Opitutae bacterium]
MRPDQTSRTVPRQRLAGAAPAESAPDAVATEEPLELKVAGRSLAVVMRTPGHDRELAAGFLWTEGILRARDEVVDLTHCGGADGQPQENVLNVVLAPGKTVDWERLQRHTFASSSCGLCGKVTIDAVRQQFAPLRAPLVPKRAVLYALPDKLRAAQKTFATTGGLHASALFTPAGELLVVREDVGRHNALDKAVGWAFFAERLPLSQCVLVVSGRVSFELMQKALAAGIPAVAAISAPTSLAVEFAQESGQTLVGFLRGEKMNVYAGRVE